MAVFSPPETFKRRADFLVLASKGRKIARPGFILQAQPAKRLRVGYTATKKLGNAVARNRARRRLKEVARLTFAEQQPALELVLICRKETAQTPFEALRAQLRSALAEACK